MENRIWSLPAPVGFDRWDLLYPIAPKPLLVMVSQRDFFGTYSPNYLTSGNEEFQKLQRVYRTLGHAGPNRRGSVRRFRTVSVSTYACRCTTGSRAG